MRLVQYFASLLATACLLTSAEASSRARNPLNYLTTIESPHIHTHYRRVHAYSHFDLTFDLHRHSQHVRLSLEPNYDILHDDAEVQFLDEEGNVAYTEKIDREAHKVFQGQSYLVRKDGTSRHVGWARIVVRRDGIEPLFEGAFSIRGDNHNIALKTNYVNTKHILDPEIEESDDEYMVLWRNADVNKYPYQQYKREAGLTCGADLLSFNTNPNHAVYRGMLKRDTGYWGSMAINNIFEKRQGIDGGGAGNGNSGNVNLRSTIGNTAGCPTTRKVALIGVATDCSYAQDFNSTETLRQNVITQVNTASDLYQSTFNVTLGLKDLTVSPASCPGTTQQATPWNTGCSDSTSISDRLNTFSQWRGQRNDQNAYWSLWTTCNTGAEVGLAWLGQLCNTGSTSQSDSSGTSQTVTGANVVSRTPEEWQVFAHETGHTFGAVHDCDSQTCADANTVNSNQCCPLSQSTCNANAQYIMNPYASDGVNHFSPCTVGNICSGLGRNSVQSTCLSDNKGVTTITGQQCGNGIVEEGEDCDCGGEEGCAGNTCCNPTTCKFNTGAVCDPSNEGCCTTSCQFSTSGTVCRASTGQCDPQEVCPGTNSTCPADKTAPDGQDCGQNLKCASGQCTSRNEQCQNLMASYTKDNTTYSCNSQTCTVSCASPDFGANVCYSLQQNFLDGTPCGGGGNCENGVCKGSSAGGEIKSWIDDNKTLVIALASALGGLLLLAILGCCIRACRRPRGQRKNAIPGVGRPRRGVHGRGQRGGWDGPAVPPQMQQRGYGGGGGGWQPPVQPQQEQNWGYPSHPPPVYSQPPPIYPGGQGRSIRYA